MIIIDFERDNICEFSNLSLMKLSIKYKIYKIAKLLISKEDVYALHDL